MITDNLRDQARAIYNALNFREWAPDPVDMACGVASSTDDHPDLYVTIDRFGQWETPKLDSAMWAHTSTDPEALICMALESSADAPTALRLYWREMGIDPLRGR